MTSNDPVGLLSHVHGRPHGKRRYSVDTLSSRVSTVGDDPLRFHHRSPPTGSRHKRHKTVAFSSVDIISDIGVPVVSIDISDDTPVFHAAKHGSRHGSRHISPATPRVPLTSSNRSNELPKLSPRKRRYTTDMYGSSNHAFSATSSRSPISSPRQRRLSDTASYHTPPQRGDQELRVSPYTSPYTIHRRTAPQLSSQETRFFPYTSSSPNKSPKPQSPSYIYQDGARGYEHGDGVPLPKIDLSPLSPRKPSILPSATHLPPPRHRIELNRRIRTTFENPTFDFAQHVKHRTYIVRSLSRLLEPSRVECVVMLDAGVDKLLPTSIVPPTKLYFPDRHSAITIEKARGKGLGLFAQKMIRANEVIFSEHPVLIMPYVVGLGLPLSQMYEDMFRRLSKGVRQELLDLLPDAQSGTSLNGEDVYESIVRLNTLAISLSVPDEEFAELKAHRGIFLRMSRCNHSCGPNAKWTWDEASFSLILTAVRQINPGDEITISYIPPHLPFSDRRSQLLQMYHFHCVCGHCIQSPRSIVESDDSRRYLTTFWNRHSSEPTLPSFRTWCNDPFLSNEALIQRHKRALNLIEREGLEILWTSSQKRKADSDGPVEADETRDVVRHMDAIAMCYGALEDTDNFLKWIKRAAEARDGDHVHGTAVGGDRRWVFRKWIVDPTSFPAWGLRRKVLDVEAVARDDGKRKSFL